MRLKLGSHAAVSLAALERCKWVGPLSSCLVVQDSCLLVQEGLVCFPCSLDLVQKFPEISEKQGEGEESWVSRDELRPSICQDFTSCHLWYEEQ